MKHTEDSGPGAGATPTPGRVWQLRKKSAAGESRGESKSLPVPEEERIRTQTGVTTRTASQELAQALPVCSSHRLPNDEQVNPAKVGYQRRRVPGAQPTPASERPWESLHPGCRGEEIELVNASARRLHSPQKREHCLP